MKSEYINFLYPGEKVSVLWSIDGEDKYIDGEISYTEDGMVWNPLFETENVWECLITSIPRDTWKLTEKGVAS